jgi:AraC-like DNA-binding protein
MRLIFENFNPDTGSSFRLLKPRLHDFFFWHYHPEYEIVYIEATEGRRHVGEHISKFYEADLVLIGPNIPHLNFDYGLKTDYQKYVIHFREDFLQKAFANTPELSDIEQLFKAAQTAVCFEGPAKNTLGKKIKKLFECTHFEQFTEMLQLLQAMATSSASQNLAAKPIGQSYNLKEQQRLKVVYAYLEENFASKIEIAQMAALTHLTAAAFCRYFKKMTKMTFTEFVNQYRIEKAKTLMLQDLNITEISVLCGFESLSYFNRIFNRITSQNPNQYRKALRN